MRTMFLALFAVAGFSRQSEPGWLSDIPGGFAEAKKTGKPLMVVFR